jgi:hypothetical protein
MSEIPKSQDSINLKSDLIKALPLKENLEKDVINYLSSQEQSKMSVGESKPEEIQPSNESIDLKRKTLQNLKSRVLERKFINTTKKKSEFKKEERRGLENLLNEKMTTNDKDIIENKKGNDGVREGSAEKKFIKQDIGNGEQNGILKIIALTAKGGAEELDKTDSIREYIMSGVLELFLHGKTSKTSLVTQEKILKKGQVGLRSMFIEDFTLLQDARKDKKIKIDNFEKVVLTNLFAGEVDDSAGNIGIVPSKDPNYDYSAVKIDHGRSGVYFYNNESHAREQLVKKLEFYRYKEDYGLGLNIENKKHLTSVLSSLEEINNIQYDSIKNVMESKLFQLEKVGIKEENFDLFYYPTNDELGLYPPVYDKKKGSQEFIKKFDKQLNIMSEMKKSIEIISKFDRGEKIRDDFFAGDWLHQIREKDPVIWAYENNVKIGGEDPIKWAINNKYQIKLTFNLISPGQTINLTAPYEVKLDPSLPNIKTTLDNYKKFRNIPDIPHNHFVSCALNMSMMKEGEVKDIINGTINTDDLNNIFERRNNIEIKELFLKIRMYVAGPTDIGGGVVLQILSKTLDVDNKKIFHSTYEDYYKQRYPLHVVTNPERLKELLKDSKYKERINEKDTNGISPLSFAIKNNYYEITEM